MINIIVAVAKNNVIGKDGKLPWDLKLDMARFKELTMGNVVIFGKNTFDEIKKPLVGRENLVLSSHKPAIDGAKCFDSLERALEYAKTTDKEIFVCGGERVYKKALTVADRLYITRVNKDFDGDRFFPAIPSDFRCVSSQKILDTEVETTFCVYKRN